MNSRWAAFLQCESIIRCYFDGDGEAMGETTPPRLPFYQHGAPAAVSSLVFRGASQIHRDDDGLAFHFDYAGVPRTLTFVVGDAPAVFNTHPALVALRGHVSSIVIFGSGLPGNSLGGLRAAQNGLERLRISRVGLGRNRTI